MRTKGRGPCAGPDARDCLALAVLIAVFGGLRLAASLDDFYIDEIWSFFLARQMGSLTDVFKLNHDNNHILNTAYLYFIGGEPHTISGSPSFLLHRLLSVVTGTVSMWLIWKIAVKKGRVEAFTALVLAGLSFPLIVYSSEARGYGPQMMFALASFLFCREYLSGRGALYAVLLWVAAVAAFLSHSSFIYIYAGLIFWSAYVEATHRRPGQAMLRLAMLHAVPLVFLVLYYLFFLKGMVYGGGEVGGAWKEVLVTASMALGSGSGGPYGYISLAVIFLLSAAGLLAVRKNDSGELVFFIAAIFFVPTLIVLVMKPEFLYFRYFLVCFPFFYLLAAYALSLLYAKGAWGKAAFSAALVFFIILNLWNSTDLIRKGRGGYSEALIYMAGATEGTEIVIGSDHDFRNKLVLDFYSRFIRDKAVVYLDKEARQEGAAQWMIRHSVDKAYSPPAYLFESGHRYTLARSYGFAGVSGWSWFLYKKDADDGQG